LYPIYAKSTSNTRKIPFFLRKNRLVSNRHTLIINPYISNSLPYLSLVEYFIEVKVEVVTREVLSVLDAETDELVYHDETRDWRKVSDEIFH
jgi:hypothetical protein